MMKPMEGVIEAVHEFVLPFVPEAEGKEQGMRG